MLHVLRLHCDDRPGIVAAVATALSEAGGNIEESSQFNDHLSGRFFMRVVFHAGEEGTHTAFTQAFERIAAQFDMTWQITKLDAPVKTLILVSKDDHCLNDILYRWRTKHLNIDIAGVVSNHDTNRALVEERGLLYHHLPSSAEDKDERLSKIIEDTGAELIVLARYMQILSNDVCERYPGRVINIHHSFLPGFKGAKPYHQAYRRGVKIIGATAHFATADLDEGPIIEQETVRIDHRHTPEKLQVLGRDTEARVLARAIALYAERRIFLHGNRTVIL
ncbi:MAG: formyltetrahydrofolate deformylase [Alphaproteobacteria bacterium]|nr:formyltetrahydrofolate deformylase [Alphaproteobacteria bacterium]